MGSYTTDNAWKRDHDEDLKDPEYAALFEASKRQLDLAIALEKAREARNLTQAQLAEVTGIKQQMISRYERGQEPAIATLRKILAALHADIVIKADGASSIMLNAA